MPTKTHGEKMSDAKLRQFGAFFKELSALHKQGCTVVAVKDVPHRYIAVRKEEEGVVHLVLAQNGALRELIGPSLPMQ